MTVSGLQIFVLEKSCGGQHDVGVVGSVGEELLVDDGEKVGAHQSADDFIVVGADRRGIRVVNEQRLNGRDHLWHDRRIQRSAELHHVDDTSGASQSFPHQLVHFERFAIQTESTAERELESATDLLPRPDQTGQHGDRTHGHAAAVGALDAVVDADHGRARGGVFAGEFADVAGGNAGPVGNLFRRILLGASLQVFEAHGVAGDVIGVEKIFVDDDVHQAERESGIGAGMDRQVPIGALRGARAIGIDDHQLRALAASFCDEGPEMNVVAVNIRAPGDDVARMHKLFRLGAKLDANHRFQAFFASTGADAALQLRSAQAVEETAVHGSAVERAQGSAVRVGQDGFAAVFGNDPAQAMRDLVESLVPGNAFKSPFSRWSDGMAGRGRPALHGSCTFRLDPSHGIEHAVGRVHAV